MGPKDPLGRKADQAIAVLVLSLLVCGSMLMVLSTRTHMLDVEVKDSGIRDYDAEEQANWKREEAAQDEAEKNEVGFALGGCHCRHGHALFQTF